MWNKIVSSKKKPLLWVISGPSGSGKTTLCNKLLQKKNLNLTRSISFSTRSLKEGEKHNKDYVFVSKEEFLKKVKRGEFIEWQEVFGNFYGTPKKIIHGSFAKNKGVLLCIDVKGAMEIKKDFPKNSVLIFIAPSQKKELARRIRMRAREEKKEIQKRLQRIELELSFVKKYDYIIVNDDLSKAAADLEAIIKAKGLENALCADRKTY